MNMLTHRELGSVSDVVARMPRSEDGWRIQARRSRRAAPSVDVVVPCYKYGHYIGTCVRSILEQPGVEVRVTIVDDCSPDGSPEVCARLARSDSRIRLIQHEINKGHIATYNDGLRLASADYVVLLSADDLLAPGSLQRATTLMEEYPNVGLVYGSSISMYTAEPPRARTVARSWTLWNGEDWIWRLCRTGRNVINCPEVVLRNSVRKTIGDYRPSLPHSGDLDMWLRAAAVSDVGRINGADQAYYRVHPSSMQRTVHAGFLHDLKERLKAFDAGVSINSHRLPQKDAMLAAARAAHAQQALARALKCRDEGIEIQGESVRDLQAFARSVAPDSFQEARWCYAASKPGAGPGGRSAAWLRSKWRRVEHHLAYRKFHRTGVF
jgi:hypothetical protein